MMCVAIRSKNQRSCEITIAQPAKLNNASSSARNVSISKSLVGSSRKIKCRVKNRKPCFDLMISKRKYCKKIAHRYRFPISLRQQSTNNQKELKNKVNRSDLHQQTKSRIQSATSKTDWPKDHTPILQAPRLEFPSDYLPKEPICSTFEHFFDLNGNFYIF